MGDVVAYPRLVLFLNPMTYRDICLNFPDTIGGTPKIVACPHQAQGLWGASSGVMSVSDRAIAAAAAAGHAVSGADVARAAKTFHLTLTHKPTFLARQVGEVEFATLVAMGLNTKFTVNNCVQFPKTAYGIPVEVSC